MDQLSRIYQDSIYLLPFATFAIGFMGSLHCVGMCGGLVMACTPKPKNNIAYHLGRLFSYSIIAILAGYLGSLLIIDFKNPYLNTVPAIFMGSIFIWFGARTFFKKSVRLNYPMKKSVLKLWARVMPRNPDAVTIHSSFAVGGLSIFLPCAFLYSVILALAAFQSPLISLICIFTFWFGTIPAIAIAPMAIKKVLRPLQTKQPILMSTLLISLGLVTIAYRLFQTYSKMAPSCH